MNRRWLIALLWLSGAPLFAADNAALQLVDASTSRPVIDAAVFFKQDEESWEDFPETTPPWRLYQVLKKGSIDYCERKPELLNNADILVVATGFQPLRTKWNAPLNPGRPAEKRLELTPAPKVVFTVTTPDGQPATGSVFAEIPPHEMLCPAESTELFRFKERIKFLLNITSTTDERGVVQIECPAFGKFFSYRVSHLTGYAEFSIRHLPLSDNAAIQERIPLNAYATIRGKYLPRIGPDESLMLYRLLDDRMTRVDPAITVSVDQHGNFEIGQLHAGWYVPGHRISYGGSDRSANSVVIVNFERFRVAQGQIVELTLGAQGRPVRGQLLLPAGYRHKDHYFEISINPDIECPTYPRPPLKMTNEEALVAWWDAYWNSDTGRRFADCRVRSAATATADDGTLFLPFVRPGTYVINRILTAATLNPPLTFPETRFTIPDDGNRQPFDLGEIRIAKP